jgi:hypothetical protein
MCAVTVLNHLYEVTQQPEPRDVRASRASVRMQDSSCAAVGLHHAANGPSYPPASRFGAHISSQNSTCAYLFALQHKAGQNNHFPTI